MIMFWPMGQIKNVFNFLALPLEWRDIFPAFISFFHQIDLVVKHLENGWQGKHTKDDEEKRQKEPELLKIPRFAAATPARTGSSVQGE